MIASWIGDSDEANEARRLLDAASLPVYKTPTPAIESFMDLVATDAARRL